MLVNILNDSREVVDIFKISFFDEITFEAKKRIESGSIRAGYFLRAGDTCWRVVEADGTLAIEIDKESTEEAKRLTRDRARESEQDIDDKVSNGSGLLRLKVSIVAAAWMIFWCYIGMELEFKYRSEAALETCVFIGILGLYPIFFSLVILLNPDEAITYHGRNGLIRGMVFLANRFVTKPKRPASTTDDHDLSMDFDEYQSLDTVTDPDLLGGDQVDGKAIDQNCVDPPKKNIFALIPRRTKWLLGTLVLALLACGFLAISNSFLPQNEFKPSSLANLQKFQNNKPSETMVILNHLSDGYLTPLTFLIVGLPLYLLISGKLKY